MKRRNFLAVIAGAMASASVAARLASTQPAPGTNPDYRYAGTYTFIRMDEADDIRAGSFRGFMNSGKPDTNTACLFALRNP